MYFPSHEFSSQESLNGFQPIGSEGKFLAYHRSADSVNAQNVAVFFHGNAGEALHRSWVGDLISPQVHVVIAEYPGYGAFAGSPNQNSLVSSAQATLDYVSANIAPHITLIGESLGTGVAMQVARHPAVQRVGLIAPFLSTVAVAKTHYPYLPVGLVLQDTYQSDQVAPSLDKPVFIVHGKADATIPFSQGERLFELFQHEEKSFLGISGIGHNDIVPSLLHDPQLKAWRVFVNQQSGERP